MGYSLTAAPFYKIAEHTAPYAIVPHLLYRNRIHRAALWVTWMGLPLRSGSGEKE